MAWHRSEGVRDATAAKSNRLRRLGPHCLLQIVGGALTMVERRLGRDTVRAGRVPQMTWRRPNQSVATGRVSAMALLAITDRPGKQCVQRQKEPPAQSPRPSGSAASQPVRPRYAS